MKPGRGCRDRSRCVVSVSGGRRGRLSRRSVEESRAVHPDIICDSALTRADVWEDLRQIIVEQQQHPDLLRVSPRHRSFSPAVEIKVKLSGVYYRLTRMMDVCFSSGAHSLASYQHDVLKANRRRSSAPTRNGGNAHNARVCRGHTHVLHPGVSGKNKPLWRRISEIGAFVFDVRQKWAPLPADTDCEMEGLVRCHSPPPPPPLSRHHV